MIDTNAPMQEASIKQTSVIIVGGGPAGAAASIFLSKEKIPHIIIEKAVFPRDKICGDAYSGKTLSVLRKADPAWIDEIFQEREVNLNCNGLKFFAPSGKSLAVPFPVKELPPNHSLGFIAPRKNFDHFLVKKTESAYATLYEGAVVRSLDRQDQRVAVTFSQKGITYNYTAPVIIGADGEKGIVRKTFFNNNVSSKAYVVGLRSYYKGITGFHPNNFIELHFIPELLPGYFWIFPLTNGMANVGIGMPSEEIRKRKINLREIMLNAIKNNPAISARFADAVPTDKIQGWGLPTCLKQEEISGDNFMLAGDAASLIDPFSGEGIGNALYSGMLAAQAAAEALSKNDFSAANLKEIYDTKLYKKIGAELRIGALMQKLSRFPWLFNFVVRKAGKSPTLNATITSMFIDLDIGDKLRNPMFYLKILFNK